VLVFTVEEFARDSVGTYERVLDWLGLPLLDTKHGVNPYLPKVSGNREMKKCGDI
jgi:hypothetical protein